MESREEEVGLVAEGQDYLCGHFVKGVRIRIIKV